MVLYINETVLLAQKTQVKNSDGVRISTYDFATPKATLMADVQPYALTQSDIQIYGINTKSANTKKMFYVNNDNVEIGNRAKIGSAVYEIKGVNKWRTHYEAILVPIENE